MWGARRGGGAYGEGEAAGEDGGVAVQDEDDVECGVAEDAVKRERTR